MVEYTLREWVDEWLYTYKRILIKPSTFDSYIEYAKHIDSSVSLREVSNIDVQKIINNMVLENCSVSTIKHTLTVIRQALYKARSFGLIENMSCMENLELPRARPKRVAALDSSQIQRIFNNSHSSHYGEIYVALMCTGCRVGELIALRWCDVDFFNGCIYVNNTDYNGQLQSVKTAHGVRCLPLYGRLEDIIRKRYNNSCKPTDRVFLNTLGRPIVYRTLLDCWHSYCNTAGLYEPLGLHVLRHTFAHTALRNGVPVKVVSSWLGHADVSITLNIYDSVDSSDMKNAAHQLEAAFG